MQKLKQIKFIEPNQKHEEFATGWVLLKIKEKRKNFNLHIFF